ncbi:UNVERIFIED_CONTAM: hypothetical protein RMT77_014910 [Armadillidium vulgare]
MILTSIFLLLIKTASSGQNFERFDNDLNAFPAFAFYNYFLDDGGQGYTYKTDSFVECKDICHMLGTNCMTVSMKDNTNDRRVTCNISSISVFDMTLKPLDKSLTFGRSDPDNETFCLGDDGFFYVLIDKPNQTPPEETRRKCPLFHKNSIFNLPKTRENFESIFKCRKSFGVQFKGKFTTNLIFDTTTQTLKWGDGTVFQETDTGQNVRSELTNGPRTYVLAVENEMQYLQEIDTPGSWSLCQVDPLGKN